MLHDIKVPSLQCEHVNGCSPVCVIECITRWNSSRNFLSQLYNLKYTKIHCRNSWNHVASLQCNREKSSRYQTCHVPPNAPRYMCILYFLHWNYSPDSHYVFSGRFVSNYILQGPFSFTLVGYVCCRNYGH